jgi:DNA-binding GntR family transcriptional regulator
MERVSLTDQVVGEIREEIVNGDLPPGTSLREQALTDRFDVGRSTVREAIKVLASEGLVTHAHHRGAIVTRHTPEDVDDLIAARTMIERHVASVGVGDPADAAAALEVLREAVARQDWRAAASADEAFHRALVAAAGSPRITAIHAQLAGEMRLLLVSADRHAPEPDKVAEHERLLQLAVAGDAEGYLRAAIHHVSRSRDTLIAVARGRGLDRPAVTR